MLRTRVIPVLLLKNKGLVKTIQFKTETYIGDPINAVKIFNDKEVDELIFLDITASKEKHLPNFELLEQLATECFMPFSYGGGINDFETAQKLLSIGIEKLIFNSLLFEPIVELRKIITNFGSSTVIGSIDIKKNFWGKYQVYSHSGREIKIKDPVIFAKRMNDEGVGEIMIASVDRDGMMNGYEIEMLEKIATAVSVPVIACSGAKSLSDFKDVVENAGASAVAAGSMFVYHGKLKGVLINFPERTEIEKYLK